MINPNEKGFNPGGIKSPPDERDFLQSEVAFASPPFNWNVGFDIEAELTKVLGTPTTIPTQDQGSSGSCGGQAFGTLNEVQEAMFTKSYEVRSKKYIYAQTAVPGGGSNGRDNADILVKQGVCYETLLSSYDHGNPPTEAFMQRRGDITDAMRVNAANSKEIAYTAVALNIDSIAQTVRDNYGVVIGLTGADNGTWLSEFPQPPKDGDSFWYHFMYAGKAKIINGVKFIGCKQHWGPGVGANGWQWLSEDYFTSKINSSHGTSPIWEARSVTYNQNPPSTSFKHTFNQDLSYGMQNKEVLALQTALQADGEFPLGITPTHYYGAVTRNAVQAFQMRYTIAKQGDAGFGRVGPLTRAKLNSLFA